MAGSADVSDTTSVREPKAPEKSVGDLLLDIPEEILRVPIRVLEGTAWLGERAYSSPLARGLFPLRLSERLLASPVASYGSNAGLEGGIALHGFSVFRPDGRLKLGLAYSTHRYQKYELSYGSHGLRATAVGATFGALYVKRPRERFYGVGLESEVDNEVAYTKEEFSLAGRWAWRIHSSANLAVDVSHTTTNTSDGMDPDREGRLNAIQALLGISPEETRSARYWTFGGELHHDWRNHPARPSSGGEERLGLYYHRGTGNAEGLEFTTAKAEIRHYLHIYRNRIVALRALAMSTDVPADAPPLPFYLLSSLGGAADLRGFRSQRFRDYDLAFASAEYRYPIWLRIDAFLAVDAGRTFSSLTDEFTLKEWQHSWGGGIRFWRGDRVLCLVQAARSREGTRFYLDLAGEF